MLFISSKKPFFFLKFLSFYPDFFFHLGKRLDKKAKVNFKTYDVTSWETNNYNKHIAQHLKNIMQEIFFFKNHAKKELGRTDADPDLFVF